MKPSGLKDVSEFGRTGTLLFGFPSRHGLRACLPKAPHLWATRTHGMHLTWWADVAGFRYGKECSWWRFADLFDGSGDGFFQGWMLPHHKGGYGNAHGLCGNDGGFPDL